MKTTSQGKYLYQLERLGFVNCYFVREDDGFTLVDTGLSGSAQAILNAARALGAPIVRIALTHAHVDHVGSLDALHTQLPDAEVLISARDARFLSGDHSLDPQEPQVKLRGGYPICATRPTRTLAPGDYVGSLEVIAAPGHTPGHVAFLDRREGTLIAGDAFQTRGGIAVSGVVRPLFPFPAMATWHKETALRSAEALRGLEPARLAVGHGPVLNAPLAAMDRAIAVARRRFLEPGAHAA
ncbi:MAG TPA: MBL fold metallo-hydrolase [Ktedonobacterales bacterium]|jgi:glyoxylase-like metal-dependent hydrolase (beta-lactamase superfamily II)